MAKICRAPQGGYYRGQPRLNAIIPNKAKYDEEEQQNSKGTLKLFNSQAKALFYTGASSSFIAIKIVRRLGLAPQTLDVSLNAESPLGVSVKLGKVCKDCPLT